MEEYYIDIELDEDVFNVEESNSNPRIIELLPILFLVIGMMLYAEFFNILTVGLENNDLIFDDNSIPTILPIKLGQFSIESGFGKRRDPFSGQMEFHRGLDFAAKRGTPVYATADGIIVLSKWNGGYGKSIKIDHQNGYKTMYGHLSKRLVRKNMKVKAGDIIGKVGSTGNSTGNHLHYEVIFNNRKVNPKGYIKDLFY